MKKSLFAIFASSLLVLTLEANALQLNPGVYEPGSHPYGALASPEYGLRLNGNFAANRPDNSHYTFDFDHALSNIIMTFDGSNYSISGNLWGGFNRGRDSNTYVGGEALWNLNWIMGTNCSAGDACGGSGTIVNIDGSGFGAYTLTGKANKAGEEFLFERGFRNYGGITGNGWVLWQEILPQTASEGQWARRSGGDFIFVQVPEPSTLAILAIGLICLGAARYKNN